MLSKNEFYFAYTDFRTKVKIFESSYLRDFLRLTSGIISEMCSVSNNFTPFHNFKMSLQENIHIIIDIDNPLLNWLLIENPRPEYIINKFVIVDLPIKNDVIITDTKLVMNEYFEFSLTPFDNWCIINIINFRK